MQSFQQMLSDDRIGEGTIVLELSQDTSVPIAGLPVVVNIDYSGVGEQGVVRPLIASVIAPSGQRLFEREFTKANPASIDFTPNEPGVHLVRVAEQHHNRVFGTLTIAVAGDDKEAP
jgi:hypothetical protein